MIPTESSLNFVGRATWEALSGHRVSTTVFDDVHEIAHVKIAKEAKLVIVAPATANVLAKAAQGVADDLLTSTLLMARSPVVFAPAMHTEMWQHPATSANVALLRERGALVIDPGDGRLTGTDSGPGRLPEPAALADLCEAVLAAGSISNDLTGIHVVVSAGGTREAIDPVRFLGNRSSGRQGWALAAAAVSRGASVNVIAANVDLPDPAGCSVTRVTSADEMRSVVAAVAPTADVVVMAAAVADFKPVTAEVQKIKKSDDQSVPELDLARTVDILAQLGCMASDRPLLVGFAAETVEPGPELVALATAKLASKNADFIVANSVGADRGFESPVNSVTIVSADGIEEDVPASSKAAVASAIWNVVSRRLPRAGS